MKKGMKKVLAYAAAAVMSISAVSAADIAGLGASVTAFADATSNTWANDIDFTLPEITAQAGDGYIKLTWEPFTYEDQAWKISDSNYKYKSSFISISLENGYVRMGFDDVDSTLGECTLKSEYIHNNDECMIIVHGGVYADYNNGQFVDSSNYYNHRQVLYVTPGKDEKPYASAKPTAGGATVKWGAVNGAVKYRVYTFVGSGKIRQFGSDTTRTSMTVKGLNGGERTGIIVLAQLANGKWTQYTKSDIVYVTPDPAVKPYLCVNPKGDGNYYLIWSSVPTSVRYKVMAREVGTDSWELIGATRQRCRITVDLDPDKEYEFLVRGLNSRGKYTPMDADDIVRG